MNARIAVVAAQIHPMTRVKADKKSSQCRDDDLGVGEGILNLRMVDNNRLHICLIGGAEAKPV